jgi:choline dehydrogenase-like flavoprotein
MPLNIDPNWMTDPADAEALVGGVRILMQALKESPLRQKVKRLVTPISENSSDLDLASYIRTVTNTGWHPVGTCRMGGDHDPMAVVDNRLRVRGVSRLRVMDGSIMPTIISANTNAPIMAIAAKGVDLMMSTPPI